MMKNILALLLLLPALVSGAEYLDDKPVLSNAVYSVGLDAALDKLQSLKYIIAAGVYAPRSITNIAVTNTAWVATNGSNSTGTLGNSNAPFLSISNAVKSLAPGGLVLIGPGLFSEVWVPLNRTNSAGISLCGSGAGRTVITGASGYSLTNQGALVTLGHSSTVTALTISNDVDAITQQAAIGFDTSKSGQVNTTNVTLRSLDLFGNSDCVYFNDTGGALASGVTATYIRTRAKWDSWFYNVSSDDSWQYLKYCWLRVEQPDGYRNLLTNVWAGNVRTYLAAAGQTTFESSIVEAVGGRSSYGIVTAFYSTQGVYSPTNWNSYFTATGTNPSADVRDFYQGGEPMVELSTWAPLPP